MAADHRQQHQTLVPSISSFTIEHITILCPITSASAPCALHGIVWSRGTTIHLRQQRTSTKFKHTQHPVAESVRGHEIGMFSVRAHLRCIVVSCDNEVFHCRRTLFSPPTQKNTQFMRRSAASIWPDTSRTCNFCVPLVKARTGVVSSDRA